MAINRKSFIAEIQRRHLPVPVKPPVRPMPPPRKPSRPMPPPRKPIRPPVRPVKPGYPVKPPIRKPLPVKPGLPRKPLPISQPYYRKSFSAEIQRRQAALSSYQK